MTNFVIVFIFYVYSTLKTRRSLEFQHLVVCPLLKDYNRYNFYLLFSMFEDGDMPKGRNAFIDYTHVSMLLIMVISMTCDSIVWLCWVNLSTCFMPIIIYYLLILVSLWCLFIYTDTIPVTLFLPLAQLHSRFVSELLSSNFSLSFF